MEDIYKKSVLFELIDINSGNIREAFTLTIPPESFDIEEPQRVSEKKTFGGLWIDDYGPDNPMITIAGNTGGMKLRKTYSSLKGSIAGDTTFDGRKAFFYFRDVIIRYKKWLVDNYEKYDLRIYDLSTAPPQSLRKGSFENTTEGYVCNLTKWKSSRNKDKPLHYNYSLELTAVRVLGYPGEVKVDPNKTKNALNVLKAIRRGIRIIQRTLTTIRNVMDTVDNLLDLIEDLDEQLLNFIDQTIALVQYPRVLIEKGKNLAKQLESQIRGLTDSERLIAFKEETEYYKSLTLSKEVTSSFYKLVANGKEFGSSGSRKYTVSSSSSDYDNLILRTDDILDEEDAPDINEAMDKDITDSTDYTTYGYKTVTVRSGATLESLAADYLGDVSYQYLLADFNGLAGDDELEVGSIIKIPSLVRGESVFSNLVYSSDLTDIYGKDIRLDKGNNPMISSTGDYAIITGIDNLIQAVNLRLNESLGRRLRLVTYGIRANIGGSMSDMTPVSYSIANIKDTLIQDPRISRVDDITVRLRQDVVLTGFNLSTIKIGDYIPYSGEM